MRANAAPVRATERKTIVSEVQSVAVAPSWRDFLGLCKPRVVLLMLLTAVVGMLLAVSGLPPAERLLYASAGIALVAGSAAVVNHVADIHIDRRMARTRRRPMAQRRVTVPQALAFSAALGVTGMTVLVLLVNPVTAMLNLASWVGYGLIYTLFLKYQTPQNIVIGGLFGAAPPLFGWTAVTNSIDPGALLLVLIIFAWTPPHFWALALERKEEYASVDVPMLPVTHGDAYTRLHILLYTLIMVAVSLLPFAIGMSGFLYLAGAVGLGAGFVYWAVVLLRNRNPRAPMETFRYSIVYLMALFAFLLADHYVPAMAPPAVELLPL